ncbi:uncharacterized protein B0P05DRAFT_561531 [Gilbertella persicaria]|uniref:uncharacterized protein n=1 Tax=Gilbertella persicaria TaxID=101096 RepID=UPI0022211A81|nr:uncharacterized protein B0P05DRAFT_561531 [Gilbertella persicaria]KAI8053679.1 hypothetical protein B0P05DRAFT_561531 [Gilbertella persicaria]
MGVITVNKNQFLRDVTQRHLTNTCLFTARVILTLLAPYLDIVNFYSLMIYKLIFSIYLGVVEALKNMCF